MMLIADSGSTKTDWVFVADDGTQIQFNTIGLNPYFVQQEEVISVLNKSVPPELLKDSVKYIFFYGAGCNSDKKNNIILQALKSVFSNTSMINIESDMLGACHALLGSSKGFVSILGTGANSCVFDGKQVQHNIRALGYILGDEGSGSYLGRMLLRDYMRGLMPQEAFVEFENMFQLKGTDILGDLYASIFPNRFLANFAQFATLNNQNEYIKRLVRQGFHDFFTNVVSQYPHYTSEHFNCVGSIGFLFKDILTQTANDFGMEVGNIIQSPIDELVKFHLKQPSSYI